MEESTVCSPGIAVFNYANKPITSRPTQISDSTATVVLCVVLTGGPSPMRAYHERSLAPSIANTVLTEINWK